MEIKEKDYKYEYYRMEGAMSLVNSYCTEWYYMSPLKKIEKAPKLVEFLLNFTWAMMSTDKTVYDANNNSLSVNL